MGSYVLARRENITNMLRLRKKCSYFEGEKNYNGTIIINSLHKKQYIFVLILMCAQITMYLGTDDTKKAN